MLVSREGIHTYDLPSGRLLSKNEGGRRLYALADGALDFSYGRHVRLDRDGQVVEELPGRGEVVGVNVSGSHFAYLNLKLDLVIRNVEGDEETQLKLDAYISRLALSGDAQHVAIELNSGEVFVGFVKKRQWVQRGKGDHLGLFGLDKLEFLGNDWLLSSGSDGVLAYHMTSFDLRGGLHFLSDGGWFSIVGRTYSSFVDGDPRGIDASLPLYMNDTQGFVWEHLRREGSLGQLLLGQLPVDKSPM